MIGSFTEVKPLFYWVQHILPLVYDDSLSYMELLGKVTKTLNELVENNNLLPDYIMKLIKEYISSGEIEKVLAEVLANYMLNVKFPPKGLTPAVGDGSADDTEAIQGCINYAYQNGGMAVYFPSGAYLTQPLTLNEKVTLFGQDRYTTRIVMKGGATKPLFTGTVDEMSLTGLGFDGNMDIQVNNVNLFTITVNSAIITNCLLTDGYDLLNITVNNELQLDNILFRHAVENALVVGGAGYVQGGNLIFKSLSTLIGKNYIVLNTNKSILEEVKCFGAAPNGVLIGGNSNVVNMWCEACQTPYVDNGTNNTIYVYGASENEKFTGNVTQYIGGFLNQTVVATKKLAAKNVIDTAGGTRQESTTGNKTETVNGNDTETVGGDKKETVSGSKSVIVTHSLDENIGTNKISVIKGTNTETITGLSTENANGGKALVSTNYNENVTNKNVTAAKIEETLTGNKTVTAASIIETVSGDRTINGGDITHTGDNITTHAKIDLEEQTDGNKVMKVTGTITETTGAKTETINGQKIERVNGNSKVDIVGSHTLNTGVLNVNTGNANSKLTSNKLTLDTVLPLGYKPPTTFNKMFKSVPFENNGVEYPVLVGSISQDLIIMPEMFGAKGNGTTDDYQALSDTIAYCIANKLPVTLRGGAVYGTTKTLIITDKINIIGNFATLKALSAMEILVDFSLPDNNRVNHTVHSVIFDGNVLANTCVRYTRTSRNIFRDNVITNFVKVGFTQQLGYELQFLNNFIIGNNSIYDSIGIIAGSDSYYDNVMMQDCHIALKANGGGTYFNNMHSWTYDSSPTHKMLKGSTFAVIGETTVGTANFYNNIYIDTLQYGFWFKQFASAVIENVFVLTGNGAMGFSPTGLNEHSIILYNPDKVDTRNITFGNSILIGQEPGYTDFSLNFNGLVKRNAMATNVAGYSCVKTVPITAFIGTLNYGKAKVTEYMFNAMAQITVPKTQWIKNSTLAIIDVYEMSRFEPPAYLNIVGVYGDAFDNPMGTISLLVNTTEGGVVIKEELPSTFTGTNVTITFEFTQTISKL